MVADHIARTKVVDGLVTPAIIHNASYFFVNLQVYADGLVNCWELLDLPLFQEKLRSGWVLPFVPDGKRISVHGLGSWLVSDGVWALDADVLYERVVGLVRELNPRMENLHDCHDRTVETLGKVRVSILGSPREQPTRLSRPEALLAKRTYGGRISVLVKDEDYYLADLRAFADGIIELGRLPNPEVIDRDGLRDAVEQGRVVSHVDAGARIRIHGLGTFIASDGKSVDIRMQLLEVDDLIEAANGRSTSVDRCRATHAAYLSDPSAPAREALRMAYESVPEHNRMYVGDMDSRDTGVRAILDGVDLTHE